MDRREFLQTTGTAALGAIATASVSSQAGASSMATEFDIYSKFEEFMRDIGGTAKDAGGKVTFVGQDPILRSHFRIGACMALPAMAAGVGAASIWRDRTGEEQDLTVDLRESIYNVNPLIRLAQAVDLASGNLPAGDPIPKSFTFVPTVNGLLYQAPLSIGSPFSFTLYETKDNRFATVTDAYPKLYDGALNVLGCPPNVKSITEAFKQFDSEELDHAMAEAGMVCSIHRTAEEWAQHPEGKYLAGTPLIDIEKIGDADPIPHTPNPDQPLSGVKTISLTHVIAGTCAARTLAEYGSDVLHIARDQAVEHDALIQEVNVGMRSSFVNLKNPDQKMAFESLLPETNVFIEGFRGRSIERLGFGVEDVVKQRPGIVYLSLRCYGWDGPWRDRGGFDMEGLSVTGYTSAEGTIDNPEYPPTRVLNDFIAGYLGAAGIIAALRRQSKEGGSYHVRVSLSRAAMWYASLGSFPTTDGFDPLAAEHKMIDPRTIKRQTCHGEIHRLAPQVQLSKTPGRWREPLVAVRGGDRPVWES